VHFFLGLPNKDFIDVCYLALLFEVSSAFAVGSEALLLPLNGCLLSDSKKKKIAKNKFGVFFEWALCVKTSVEVDCSDNIIHKADAEKMLLHSI
jgi:hypothetical protein